MTGMKRLAIFFACGAVLHLATRAMAPEGAEAAARQLRLLPVRVLPGQDPAAVVEEALLVDLALERGAALTDPVVRDRLLSAVHRLGGEPTGDTSALERAVKLGLPLADPVVRQRLRFHGEQALAPPQEPSSAQLQTFIAARSERYRAPERVTLEHRFYRDPPAGDDCPPHTTARAVVAGAGGRGDAGCPGGARRGDPTSLPLRLENATLAELEARFGPEVLRAVRVAPLAVWSAPVRSPFGFHRVRVEGRRAGGQLPFHAIEKRALADWRAETHSQRLDDALAELQLRRRIVVTE